MFDFWTKVSKSGECWTWQGAIDTRGYGHLRWNGKIVRAHRLAYSLANDWPLPERGNHCAVIMHSCDNRQCCNPAHLTLGTQRDNILDMERKCRSRHPEGERNGRAKLSSSQVQAIRSSNQGKVRLSQSYGVSPAQIHRIRTGKQWAS